MRLNYKKLGSFIKRVDKRNKDLVVDNLKGLSMTKEFRESTSNIIGTDMSKYKIVDQWQFTCDFMSVIRVHAFPVVLNFEPEPVLVSPAYPVFEITNTEELDPEYLMIWFRRSEFDRYADFKCDSAIRGGFGWDELCEAELPVPSIEKQREIVREYNVVHERIMLNKLLIKKLEEATQAIYEQWFLNFEFPISKSYAQSVGKPMLEGLPYRSSGGKMEYCDDTEQNVPVGWKARSFTELFDLKGGGTPSTSVEEYWGGQIPFFTPKDVTSSFFTISTLKTITDIGYKQSSTKKYPMGTTFITARGTVGAVSLASSEMAMNQSCYAVMPKEITNYIFIHQHATKAINTLKNEAIGGVFDALVTADFDGCKILSPSIQVTNAFGEKVEGLYKLILSKQKENVKLKSLISLIKSKLTKI